MHGFSQESPDFKKRSSALAVGPLITATLEVIRHTAYSHFKSHHEPPQPPCFDYRRRRWHRARDGAGLR